MDGTREKTLVESFREYYNRNNTYWLGHGSIGIGIGMVSIKIHSVSSCLNYRYCNKIKKLIITYRRKLISYF